MVATLLRHGRDTNRACGTLVESFASALLALYPQEEPDDPR